MPARAAAATATGAHRAHCLFTVLNKKRIYYAKWLNIINNKLFR